MKKNIIMILASLALMVSGTSAMAQDKAEGRRSRKENVENTERQRPSREEMSTMMAKRIAEQLAFDDATTEQFVKTYSEYQKEVWASGPGVRRMGADKEMDEKTAEQMNQERLEHQKKIQEIRSKYYDEYSKFLTQKQINKVEEIEKEMRRKMMDEHRGQRRPQGDRQGFHQGGEGRPQGLHQGARNFDRNNGATGNAAESEEQE
jgi:hypothetical protein